MKKVIIFCNAPFYVQQTLGLYEMYRGKADISIFVLQVEGIYQFLDSLNLELDQLIFIPNLKYQFRLRSPVKNVLNRMALSGIKKRFFKETRSANIFFSGEFFDPVMHACIAHLQKENSVLDFGYPSSGLKKFPVYTWKQRASLKLLKRMTGAQVYLGSLGDAEEYRQSKFFNNEAYGIQVKQESVDLEIIQRCSWRPEVKAGRSRFLFMENDEEHMYWNYEEVMLQLLDVLNKSGVDVYIKPHPRIGCSPFLREIATLHFIPAYVPAQFIRDEDFIAVGSLFSTSLIDFALRRQNVFCFELLFDRKSEKDRRYTMDLMSKEQRLVAAGKQLLLPKKLQELKELLPDPSSVLHTSENSVSQ